jgi:hypothetical protein
MAAGLTRQRVWLDRDARVIAEHVDGVELESDARLRPGHPVELRMQSATHPEPVVKHAFVVSWRVSRVDTARPTFRGFCRWQHSG